MRNVKPTVFLTILAAVIVFSLCCLFLRNPKDDSPTSGVITANTSDDLFINAKNPPDGMKAMVMDGISDDSDALQSLINYCAENGYNLYIPAGTAMTTQVIDGASNMTIKGAGIGRTILNKSEASTNARGIDAVIDVYGKTSFNITGIEFIGNRTSYAEGNAVSVNGLYVESCSYFGLSDLRFSNCLIGLVSKMNWCCSYDRFTAIMCQSYAFQIQGASTSTILNNFTSWGCGGLFDISGCIYTTIICPACDHSDCGGWEEDPFLPQGSGGNYQNPGYLFHCSNSKLTIISPGAENGFSKYMYSEGCDITLLNPYIYNMQGASETWRFIELRGTGISNLKITNPDFSSVSNTLPASHSINGIYIENPNVQKIECNKFLDWDDSFGDYKQLIATTDKVEGVYYDNTNDLFPGGELLNGVFPGAMPFIPKNNGIHTDGLQVVGYDSDSNRQLVFSRGSSTVGDSQVFNMSYRLPLPVRKENAIIQFSIKGAFSGAYGNPSITIMKGTAILDMGTSMYTGSISGGIIDLKGYVTLTNEIKHKVT